MKLAKGNYNTEDMMHRTLLPGVSHTVFVHKAIHGCLSNFCFFCVCVFLLQYYSYIGKPPPGKPVLHLSANSPFADELKKGFFLQVTIIIIFQRYNTAQNIGHFILLTSI